jgi:hypothetical protein
MKKKIASAFLRLLGVDAWDENGTPYTSPRNIPKTD